MSNEKQPASPSVSKTVGNGAKAGFIVSLIAAIKYSRVKKPVSEPDLAL